MTLYHDTLVEHGVEGYSMRWLRSNLREGLLAELATTVVL